MGFSSYAGGLFPRDVRRQGAHYALQGRVKILEHAGGRLLARIADKGIREVVLDWTDGHTLRASCTCPDFDGDELCVHIWATGVAAEARGLMRTFPERGSLDVVPDGSVAEDIEIDGGEEREEPRGMGGREAGAKRRARPPRWVRKLGPLQLEGQSRRSGLERERASTEQILYVLDRQTTLERQKGLALRTWIQRRRVSGGWGPPSLLFIDEQRVETLSDPLDLSILAALLGGARGDLPEDPYSYPYSYGYYRARGESSFTLRPNVLGVVMPRLLETGRLQMQRTHASRDFEPLSTDAGPPWELRLRVRPDEARREWVIEGFFAREGQVLPMADPTLCLAGGYLLEGGRVARLEDHGSFQWIPLLRMEKEIRSPFADADILLEALHGLPRLPPVVWPEPLRLEEVRPPPRPCITVRPADKYGGSASKLLAAPAFRYGDAHVAAGVPGERIACVARRQVILRDAEAERTAMAQLPPLGFRDPPAYLQRRRPEVLGMLALTARRLPRAVRELLARGWHVEAEGKLYRQAGEVRIEVRSGVDWFDLDGQIDFDGKVLKLPALLEALRRGESAVVLDDGTLGVLPEDWLRKHSLLLGAGEKVEDRLRFRRCQVGFLDALLAAHPAASADEAFEALRREIGSFEGLRAAEPSPGFRGDLRPYQKDGLGWMGFLRRFGFGGILADDMGLGKTVQVLALLEARRESPDGERRHGPSLVVVPRSLVFNWRSEAARFAPGLRVLDHTGMARTRATEHLDGYDLVLTTYGTLRRDIAFLKEKRFDYVVLDETQAVKNSRSESAKAVRLLQGDHRQALSGTPIENHLGELWSIFEFLNPGMLGQGTLFQRLSRGDGRRDGEGDGDRFSALRRALRPFILRRTKEQVASDLPEKLEQTLICDLESEDRRRYDELRDHYRAALLGRLERDGLARSRFHVLEALLRLRQAACHAGLVDKRLADEPSAKLEILFERLAEVAEGGHKALIFSQFTSFLAIVRKRLDGERIPYEYLDGGTRDRAERVRRFQEDPDCKLFLVSLKAGGLGLNLTAAEYVFLLDPWWNPAVEAQAIDRAHRIGQRRRVFAFRIVARDTVEEKVLELQRSKRELADAIINADDSLLGDLTRDDLETLLS
ncbi:MAG: DEAD/DEAH box helicase [Planctomycetes bacterium]|nr:DEAD/DEAH box helicase [Planctomycetota bacterium]